MAKVGLVLSGGVAKGAYEAGVLKAFAERGVQPDVIVGISAGAMNGTVVAGLLMQEQFSGANIEKKLYDVWRKQVSLQHFYKAGTEEHSLDGSGRALSQLFSRFGIDPFSKVYLPTRFDRQALDTLEKMLKGHFSSIFSGAYFRQLTQDLVLPAAIKRPVRFSAVMCNLLGGTSLVDEEERIENSWAHYEDFHWYPEMPHAENFVQFNRLLDVITGSGAFPLMFPPLRMTPVGAGKAGLYIDGGMTDNSPIGKAIAMDGDIDTLFVVMATTIVPPLDNEPRTIMTIFSRMCEMLAGKFLINNYHKVLKVNRRITALQRVLEKDPDGRIKDSEFNHTLCEAAGFRNVEDFRRRRVVRIIPVIPSTPLVGDLFAGFHDTALIGRYIETGYQDGHNVLAKRFARGSTVQTNESEE
jgi:predicted acylesterase/phospholipase RssA